MNSEGLDKLDYAILHVIKDNARMSYSEIGEQVGISRVAVKNRMDALEKKGYVERKRSIDDKRVVKASLLEKGKTAYYHHEQFHRQMIEHAKEGLSEQEMTVLIYALAKLVDYFNIIYWD